MTLVKFILLIHGLYALSIFVTERQSSNKTLEYYIFKMLANDGIYLEGAPLIEWYRPYQLF